MCVCVRSKSVSVSLVRISIDSINSIANAVCPPSENNPAVARLMLSMREKREQSARLATQGPSLAPCLYVRGRQAINHGHHFASFRSPLLFPPHAPSVVGASDRSIGGRRALLSVAGRGSSATSRSATHARPLPIDGREPARGWLERSPTPGVRSPTPRTAARLAGAFEWGRRGRSGPSETEADTLMRAFNGCKGPDTKRG